jgi:hypothetical protein
VNRITGALALPKAVAAIALASFFSAVTANAGTSTTHLFDAEIAAPLSPQPMYFPITRTGDATYDVVASYHTEDGSAIAGLDYLSTSGSLVIPTGDAGGFVPVTIVPTASRPSVEFQLHVDSLVGIADNPVFSTAQAFASGTSPYAIVAGDLNGDGLADLVVGNSDDATVSVLLNTTNPGDALEFAAQHTFATGIGPYSVALADINSDGKLDIVTANETSNTLSVLLNETSPGASIPQFSLQQTFEVGELPTAVAAADLNGDGRIDLVVTNGADMNVSVLLNTTQPGNHTVTFATSVSFATEGLGVSVVCADINGDGLDDLAVANTNTGTVSVLLNTTVLGSLIPSFTPYESFSAGDSPKVLVSSDLDGDGRPDLVAADEDGGTVSVLANTTPSGADAPSFAETQAFETEMGVWAVTVEDTNGDGKPDLVVSGDILGGTVTVLRNSTAPGSPPNFTAPVHFATASTLPVALVSADFNGDGKPDVATTNLGVRSISTLENVSISSSASLEFGDQPRLATGAYPFSGAVGDFNGDGRADIVTANTVSNSLSILVNQTVPGAGPIAFAPQQEIAVGAKPYEVSAVDLNDDGRTDIAALNNRDGTVSVLMNGSVAGEPSLRFTQQTFAVGVAPLAIASTDINRDGFADLVVTDPGSSKIFAMMNESTPGSSTVSFGVPQGFATGANPYAVAAADINGDGAPDLVIVEHDEGTVSVLLNTTSPGSTTASFLERQTLEVNGSPVAVAIGDINADGRPDIVVVGYGGVMWVLINNTAPGATTISFDDTHTFFVAIGAVWASLADIDGDGRQDILVADAGIDTVALYLNLTPPGTSSVFLSDGTPVPGAYDSGWVVARDLDGDGRLDIVATHPNDNQVSIFANRQYRTILSNEPATGTIVHDEIFANGFE